MDGSIAIDRNLEALKRILAALIAMAGLGETFWRACDDAAGTKTLPRRLYRAVLLILRPAEASARRLIIAMAQSIVVELKPQRPIKPKPDRKQMHAALRSLGIAVVLSQAEIAAAAAAAQKAAQRLATQAVRPLAFHLTDPLPYPFRQRRKCVPAHRAPHIWALDGGAAWYPLPPPPSQDDPIDAEPLERRLAGLASALDDLPKQVRRFARWRARRDRAHASSKIHHVSPLRRGRPPGGRLSDFDPTAKRRRNIREIDEVLAHAHALAVYALEQLDTS